MVIKIMALISILLSTTPNRRLAQDIVYREEMATLFVDTALEYRIDPFLLAYWSFRESSLDKNAVGSLGEVGLTQVHGVVMRRCDKLFNLRTEKGQIQCGAYTIALARTYCGSLERGLYRYASGRCKGTARAIRITKHRLRKIIKFKAAVEKRLSDGK